MSIRYVQTIFEDTTDPLAHKVLHEKEIIVPKLHPVLILEGNAYEMSGILVVIAYDSVRPFWQWALQT